LLISDGGRGDGDRLLSASVKSSAVTFARTLSADMRRRLARVPATIRSMLELLILIVRAMTPASGGHEEWSWRIRHYGSNSEP
jgi:hypothetical protein